MSRTLAANADIYCQCYAREPAVSVLLLLQARGKLTAGQLASELEVSVRTIYRDIESLSAAGVPVYGDAGPMAATGCSAATGPGSTG